jgi:hypothetical protein
MHHFLQAVRLDWCRARCDIPDEEVLLQAHGATVGDAKDWEVDPDVVSAKSGQVRSLDSVRRITEPGPVLIISLGPTGCGKTGQERDLEQKLRAEGLMKDGEVFPLLIDDYVESDPVFRQRVFEKLQADIGDNPSEEDVVKFVDGATATTYNFFGDTYSDVRKDRCSSRFRQAFAEHISAGDNIIFESTGERFPSFAVQAARNSGHKYQVHVGFNLIHFGTLKERIKGRFVSKTVSFLRDPDHYSTPRLPDLDNLAEQVRNILATMTNFIQGEGEGCIDSVDGFHIFSNQENLTHMRYAEQIKGWSKLKKHLGRDNTSRYLALLETMEPQSESEKVVSL